ncbi:hypothetical protein HHI36_010619 [Cryptolaemus montrouzieri]|uniref:Uncharacterized protein n=1 Tax=Cryptolaemus montrouzieri TaxID=559131 RepID=A0ABD2MJE2_9CUCU
MFNEGIKSRKYLMSALKGVLLGTTDHAYDEKRETERVMISEVRTHVRTRKGRMTRRQYQLGSLDATDIAEVLFQVGDYGECEMLPEYQEIMKTINFIDTVATLIIPIILIVVMNTMIARGLMAFKQKLLKKEFRHSKFHKSENLQEETQVIKVRKCS